MWITKYRNYSEIEESILKSVGSFNWLYENNDTVLFNKEGRFETAIIDLAGKIMVGTLKEYSDLMKAEKKGNLFLVEKMNIDFEFLTSVVYAENEDVLYSFPTKFDDQSDSIILIAEDFGFVIIGHQLKGWFLKKASEHICVTQEYNKDITPHMLARYLSALKLWEENEDAAELKSLLEESKIKEDELSCALRECITNLL